MTGSTDSINIWFLCSVVNKIQIYEMWKLLHFVFILMLHFTHCLNIFGTALEHLSKWAPIQTGRLEPSSNQIHCVTKISFMQQQSCFIAISWHSCSLICLKSHIILIWTVFQFCVCLCVCRTCGLREPRTLQRTNFLASCAGLKSSQSPLWVWRACVPSKAPNQMRICRLA